MQKYAILLVHIIQLRECEILKTYADIYSIIINVNEIRILVDHVKRVQNAANYI